MSNPNTIRVRQITFSRIKFTTKTTLNRHKITIKKAGGAPAFSKVLTFQYTFLALITSSPSIVKSVSVSIIV